MTHPAGWIDPRAARYADLYRAGATLQEIGSAEGVTRERVRQLLKTVGVTKKQSGKKKQIAKLRKERLAATMKRREKTCQMKHGCSLSEYKSAGTAAHRAFIGQKRTAWARGIEWDFVFWDWWRVWQQSGEWGRRGVSGFVMARRGDVGPYAPWNVEIKTSSENIKESYVNRPVRKNMRIFEIDGRAQHGAAWCREFGVKPETFYARLRRGLGLVAALTATHEGRIEP